jgi:hypothetical protein
MRDGISVGRSNLFLYAMYAGASVVACACTTALATCFATSQTVCTAETSTHQEFGVEGENSEVARPFLLGRFLLF